MVCRFSYTVVRGTHRHSHANKQTNTREKLPTTGSWAGCWKCRLLWEGRAPCCVTLLCSANQGEMGGDSLPPITRQGRPKGFRQIWRGCTLPFDLGVIISLALQNLERFEEFPLPKCFFIPKGKIHN